MKKNYVSFQLNVIEFDENDAIRTSGVTSTTENDVEVLWGTIFGGQE